MHEDRPGFLHIMETIYAVSERSFTNKFRLASAPSSGSFVQSMCSLLTAEHPTALLIADRRMGPAELGLVLEKPRDHKPTQLFLYGQMLEEWHQSIAEISQICAQAGFVPDYGFDPNICQGFRLEPS
jgi:hypothetical protein